VIKAQITKSVFRPHHTFTIARLPTRGFRGTARRMERVGQQNGLVFARRGETFLRSAIFFLKLFSLDFKRKVPCRLHYGTRASDCAPPEMKL
jgi:hypothetical protein